MDTSWYRSVNDFARDTPWLHGFLAAYALWGGLVVLAVILVASWWLGRGRRDAPTAVATTVLTGVACIVALLLNQQLISPAIARPRPCLALHHVEVLLTCNRDYSMPSDHCVIAGAFVAGLWLLNRRTGMWAAALALLLAFGRVYVGVHYPSDAIVGLLVGAAVALVIVLALRQPVARLCIRLADTPLRPLVLARGRETAGAAAHGSGQRPGRHSDQS
ncbi:MAG: phosphatase PAP2 family protein [Marmoricola sp.]